MTPCPDQRRPIQPDNVLLPLLVLTTLGGVIGGLLLALAMGL